MRHNLVGTEDQRKDFRVALIASTDWLTTRHRDQRDAGEITSLTEAQYAELLAYKQSLRDWPISGSYNEAFPAKPHWMAQP